MRVMHSGPMRLDGRVRMFGLLVSLALVGASAQSPQPPADQTAAVTTRDAPLTFKTKVNLVSVPVVVRDAQGHAAGNLSREDFQIFDNGKPQIISRFSVETFGKSAPAQPAAGPAEASAKTPPAATEPTIPERYVAFFFDDMNLSFAELARARDAASRYLETSLQPGERAAVYSSSGRTALDFTDDRDRLRQTLLAIRPEAVMRPDASCPPMTVYEADLIDNKQDPSALEVAISDVIACSNVQMTHDDAEREAKSAAQAALRTADFSIRAVLDTLDAVVRKMSMMAGQRTIVLVSSGFQVLDDRRQDEAALFERALRANVVVNALDARALYAIAGGDASERVVIAPEPGTAESSTAGGDASQRVVGSALIRAKAAYSSRAALLNGEVMAEAADATGGRFFQNSNDLEAGFARLAAAPEYLYVLGFNPENLKLDGKYHSLKVTVRNSRGAAIEARRGYYPPRYAKDPAEQAKEEIEEAVFSRDETHDIPVVVQTQFFKTTDDEAALTVAAKVDVRKLPFRKEEGRNRNDLTVVAGLFDSDGNFVSGTQKIVEMRLRDDTLASGLSSGLTVRNTFTVTPGTYLIRLVVRDSEGRTMTAQSATVEIP